MKPRLITLREFCERVRIRYAVGRRYCVKRTIPAVRVEGRWRVDARAIPAFLKNPPWQRPGWNRPKGPTRRRFRSAHERVGRRRRT